MTRFATRQLVVGSVIAGMATLTLGVTGAQEKPALQQPSAQTEIGDRELRAFARSYLEFHKIRAEYEPALNQARDPQAQGKIEQEALAKFDRAVQQQGLTLESYFRLYQTVNANEHIREKAIKLIDEERKKA
jgi:uncharacterized protein DUF4168